MRAALLAAIRSAKRRGQAPGVLRWPPPTGYTGFTSYTINADGTGASSSTVNGVTTHTLNDGVDYKINAPATITNAISIKGGRNVVWFGGHVQIDNKGSFPIGDVRRALLIQDGAAAFAGRVVHLEGILLDGNDLADALDLDCPAAVVQVQMYRGDGCHFRSCDDRDSTQGYAGTGTHPDVIQPWGGCRELRVDYVTGVSAYQGFFLNSLVLAEAPAKTYISRYNWRAFGHTSNEEGPYTGGAFAGPTETYYGIRALSLGANWNDIYIDSTPAAGVYIEHSALAGWTTPGNTGPSRKGTSGFYNTRFYEPTHSLADANGYVLDPPPGTANFYNAVIPDADIKTVAYVEWATADARIHNWDGTGNARAYAGAPPGGDYVAASSVGVGYVSPGYLP